MKGKLLKRYITYYQSGGTNLLRKLQKAASNAASKASTQHLTQQRDNQLNILCQYQQHQKC